MDAAILIRYGEIGLKGGNRPAFERQLAHNVDAALRGLGARRARRIYGRLLVEIGEDAVPEALERLQRVFGIVGASRARVCPLDMGAIEAATLAEVAAALERQPATFRIDARRSHKGFPLDSVAINRQLGAAVLRAHPHLKVNLERPDLTVHVEIRDRAAYVYGHEVRGPGGLPVGVSSRALLLLSGGIDSPVAGWMAASRGIALEAIHFHSFPFTSEGAQQKAMDLCALLSRWTGRLTMHLVRFTDIQKAIYQHVPAPMGVTIMRRFMMRIAERIATARNIPALVTGESVGQVASQTIESIATIQEATRMLVLRPLTALDKESIIARAQHIGSYPISIRPYEDCCTVFVARHPETRPDVERARQAEEPLDVDGLVEGALAQTEQFHWSWGEQVEAEPTRAVPGARP